MPFDVYYSTLLESRNFIMTVDDSDIAAAMCLKNNKTLSQLQMNVGMGNMFFEET